MRLFPKVDGTVDRFERAGLLTMPFDLALASPSPVPEKLCFTAESFGIPSFSAETLSIPSFSTESFEVCE